MLGGMEREQPTFALPPTQPLLGVQLYVLHWNRTHVQRAAQILTENLSQTRDDHRATLTFSSRRLNVKCFIIPVYIF